MDIQPLHGVLAKRFVLDAFLAKLLAEAAGFFILAGAEIFSWFTLETTRTITRPITPRRNPTKNHPTGDRPLPWAMAATAPPMMSPKTK